MSDYSLHSAILFYKAPGGLPCHFMVSGVFPSSRHSAATPPLPGSSLGGSCSRCSSILVRDSHGIRCAPCSQPFPAHPACQLAWHRGAIPRGWHLLRTRSGTCLEPPPCSNLIFFLNGFANYPAFLCCLPSEHAAGTGPRPGSSSQRESPQHACSLPGWEASSTASPRTLLAAAAAVSPCR